MTRLLLCLLLWAPLAEAQEITFPSDGVELGATLQIPDEPVAGVVLLPVAGPTDRDMTLGPKKIYGDLSAALAEKGGALVCGIAAAETRPSIPALLLWVWMTSG